MLRKLITNCVGLTGVCAIISCGGDKSQQQMMAPQAVAVTVAEVTSSPVVFYDEYPATVAALNQVDLRPQVSGYITGIYFTDGEKVGQGQKLYSIDAQLYEANYQQAVATLQVQKSNLAKAQKDADRYHQLDKQDAIAKQQVDYADAALDAAKKQVEAAEANVTSMQTNVKYTIINAPFDGTIGISQVKMGAPVSAGQTVLNTISSDNPVAVDFSFDQKELYRFSQMEQGDRKSGDSTFTLAFGNAIYPYPGNISFIDRAVDPQTGTIKIRLIFPNDKSQLKPGMTGTLRVLNNGSEKSIVIPFKAVTEQLGEYFVYVVNDSGRVNQRKILPGKQLGTKLIIKDGLKEGEQIAVQGVQNLREGSAIRIDTSAHAAAPIK